ncbi:hypothetical protein GCM10009066_17360 [Halarchaeum salinum]|uniref:VCBS repeat-containing protein n=1 Tax=Halarchaeum salinum TaxID=489912 RepID=A0AAV3S7D8_9EURY
MPTGETSRTLTATNRLNQTLAVTVSLVNGSSGDATLHAGGSSGDSVSASLAPGETTSVDAAVDCGADALHLSITATNGSFRFHAIRTVETVARCGDDTVSRSLVYVNTAGELRTLAGPNAAPTSYSVTPETIGPATVDFDGDGTADVPYSPDGSTIALTDGDGARTLNGTLYGTPSRLWAGAWNGSGDAVYYASTAKNVTRVRPGGRPTTAVVVSSTTPKAVVGVADVAGDSARELVFVGGSQQLRFAYENGTTVQTAPSAATGDAVGTPTDFDGNGHVRVPIVDGSNALRLAQVKDNGAQTTKLVGGVEKTGVASLDWDGDGTPEILYVDASSHRLMYVDDVTGAATTHRVQSANGNVTVGGVGVA